MTRILIEIGLLLFLLIPCVVRCKEATLEVGPNVEIKVGEPVSLDCFGSKPSLSYYIKNKMRWSHNTIHGTIRHLTDAFYFDMSVRNEFSTGHFMMDYETVGQEFRYRLNISSAKHSDDGTYICSLIGTTSENGVTRQYTIDQKHIKVTVLNPVENIILRIPDIPSASAVDPVSRNGEIIKVTEGQYRVHCRASGSNPAPVMGLLYNEEAIYVVPKFTFSVSRNQIKYTGEVDIPVNINGLFGSEQTLVCFANVPNLQHQMKEAGLRLRVKIEKPNIVCKNITIGDSNIIDHVEIVCNITKPSKDFTLSCAQVFWELRHEQLIIPGRKAGMHSQETKHNESAWDSTCQRSGYGLSVSLKASYFDERDYFVRYGEGQRARRIPIYIHDETSSSPARRVKPILICIILLLLMYLS